MNETLQSSMGQSGALLFMVVFLEQTGVPIPAAPCLLAAGALCATGESNMLAAIGTVMVACLVADCAWFCLGRRGGSRVLQFLCRLGLAGNLGAEQLGGVFHRHGVPVLALAKFLPGLNVVAPPLAGALGLGFGRFLLFDGLGALLYAGFYLLLGSVFSDQVKVILEFLNHFGMASLVVLGGLAVAWVFLRHHPRRKAA